MAKVKNYNDVLAEFAVQNREVKYLKTGCVPIDIMFENKGLPLGALGQFYSDTGMGKSTTMLTVSKGLCKQGHDVWYLSFEPNKQLIDDMGLNDDNLPGKFYNLEVTTYNDLDKITRAFLDSPADLMVIDSLSAVVLSALAAGDNNIEDSLPGRDSQIRTSYLKLYGGLLKKYDKAIVYICQARANWDAGWMGKSLKSEGGTATQFFAAYRFCMQGSAKVVGQDIGQDTGAQVGTKGYYWAEKSRFARGFAKIPAQVIFGKGVSNVYSILQYAVWRGYIQQAGSVFKINFNGTEESVKGKVARLSWVKAHMAELKSDLESHFEEYFKALLEGAIMSV